MAPCKSPFLRNPPSTSCTVSASFSGSCVPRCVWQEACLKQLALLDAASRECCRCFLWPVRCTSTPASIQLVSEQMKCPDLDAHAELSSECSSTLTLLPAMHQGMPTCKRPWTECIGVRFLLQSPCACIATGASATEAALAFCSMACMLGLLPKCACMACSLCALRFRSFKWLTKALQRSTSDGVHFESGRRCSVAVHLCSMLYTTL